jgi:hypothetical protein
MNVKDWMHGLTATCLCAALVGCGSAPRLPAVPQALQQQAVVPGMPKVR